MKQLGLILTSAHSLASLQEHASALQADVVKVITGWGLPWSAELRHAVLRLAPATIVRTVHGDPSVAGGAHRFLHPEHVISEIRPWWEARDPSRQFLIELGNEQLLQPEPDDWRALEHGYYLDRAIAACRAEFPGAQLVAPAHTLNHAVAVGGHEWGQERYLELHKELYRRCDFVGLHAYTVEQYARGAEFVRKHVGEGTRLYLTEFALNERLGDAERGRRYAELLRVFDVAGACLYHLDELGGTDPLHFNPNYRLNVATLASLAAAWRQPAAPIAPAPAKPAPAPAPMTPPARPPVKNVAMTCEHLTRGRRAGPVRALVMHATAGRWPSDLDWLKKGGDPARPVSCHYYIDKMGSITQLVADHDTAWHAGASTWRGLEVVGSLNPVSIGIELENRNDGKDRYPEAQIAAAVALARHLVATYGIERANLVRHLDISPGRKTDPAGFPWASFVERVYGGPR